MKKPAPQSKAYKTLNYLLHREERLQKMKEYYHRTKEDRREHINRTTQARIHRSPEHKAAFKAYQDRYHAEDWKENRKLEKLRVEHNTALNHYKKVKSQAEYETRTTGLTPETAEALKLVTGIRQRIRTQYNALKAVIDKKAKTRYVHNYKTIPNPAEQAGSPQSAPEPGPEAPEHPEIPNPPY